MNILRKILFVALVVMGMANYANAEITTIEECKSKPGQCVALLKTETPTHPEEMYYSYNFPELMERFGKKVVFLDYNKLVDWSSLEGKSEGEIESEIISKVSKFLSDSHITNIILPGDWYNYNKPPYHPGSKSRFYFTFAITKLIQEGKVFALGVCGGMQGIMHFNNVSLGSVQDMVDKSKINNSKASIEDYKGADSPLIEKAICNTKLTKIFINPNTHLAHLVQEIEKLDKTVKFDRDEKGWIISYLPLAHSNAVINSTHNLLDLENAGFKISAITEDGVPEVVEDSKGMIHLQGHPEISALVQKTSCPNLFEEYRSESILARVIFANFLEKGKISQKTLKEIIRESK